MSAAGGAPRVPTVAASTGLLASLGRPPGGAADVEAIVGYLRLLRDAGYSAVDLSDLWTPLARLDSSAVRALSSALDRLELEVVGASVIDLTVEDDVAVDRSAERGRRAIDNAVGLGAPVVSIGLHNGPGAGVAPGDVQPPWLRVNGPLEHSADTRARAVRLVGVLTAHAEIHGVSLSLEMNELSLLDRAAACLELVDAVGSPALGVNPDLGSLVRVPWPLVETWVETLIAVAPVMNYWHVKNCHRIGMEGGRFVATPSTLPEGCIDYRRALAIATGSGYSGPLVVEHYGGDVLWYAEHAQEYLTGLVGAGSGGTTT